MKGEWKSPSAVLPEGQQNVHSYLVGGKAILMHKRSILNDSKIDQLDWIIKESMTSSVFCGTPNHKLPEELSVSKLTKH